MKQNTIITIGRQFGSGGHEIAVKVAEALSIPFYDREIIVEAAKKSGLDENLFKHAEERTVSSFLYSVALGAYSTAGNLTGIPMLNMNETIFQVQAKVIKEYAEKGSCVFVGRCADHILKAVPNCHNLFIYADMPAKIKRVQEIYNLSSDKAEELITKTDKKRAGFYNYYSGKKWNDFNHYDLCINSGKLGVDGAVDMILTYIRLAQEH